MDLEEQEGSKGDDLSEGEIPDSNGSMEEEGEKDAVAEPGPAAKKRKLSSEEGGKERALDASIAMNFGSFKSSLSKNQLKKLRKKKKELRRSSDAGKKKTFNVCSNSVESFTEQQKTILKTLKEFRVGGAYSGAALPRLKTAQFKDVVFSLVHSPSQVNDGDSGSDGGTGRVVVVWLSMVSERYFTQSPNHFPQLKKFNPVLKFKLEHPGSNRFVKLGLEAFMFKSNQSEGNDGAAVAPTSSTMNSSFSPPPRTGYLFTKCQLEENGFPVLESPVGLLGLDCSTYLQLFPWPKVEVRDSLTDLDSELPIFAIDCEMVETQKGSELARISIVNESLDCIYDTFVKPDSTIVDYRTKFSGISEETLKDVSTTLHDVQEKLKSLLPPRCIFAGHSLENDFHAMKLIHPYVIDTSCIFTPFASPMFKPKLKKLSMELLSSEIQGGSDGHNSIEDASACMKLVQRKLREGPNLMLSFNQPATSLLSELQLYNHTTGIVDKVGVVRLFGRNSTHCCDSSSDSETIERSIEVIPKCDLTFVQLHDMENFVKSADKNDSTKELQVANDLDMHVMKLVEGCPCGTLVFIVCGSSDISKVKRYQQQDFPDLRRWKEATMVARTGQVVALVVN